MKRTYYLFRALIAVLLGGCAHEAKHYNPVDAKPLVQAQGQVAVDISKASTHIKLAAIAIQASKKHSKDARFFHKAEGDIILEAKAVLERPEFRNAPPDLKPLVDELTSLIVRYQATALKTEESFALSEAQQATASRENELADSSVLAANKGMEDINTKYGPEFIKQSREQTDKLNAAEKAWEKDSKIIVSLIKNSIWLKILGFFLVAGVILLILSKLGFNVLKVIK